MVMIWSFVRLYTELGEYKLEVLEISSVHISEFSCIKKSKVFPSPSTFYIDNSFLVHVKVPQLFPKGSITPWNKETPLVVSTSEALSLNTNEGESK